MRYKYTVICSILFVLLGRSELMSSDNPTPRNLEIQITDSSGKPLDKVMVTMRPRSMLLASQEDNGYPTHGTAFYLNESDDWIRSKTA